MFASSISCSIRADPLSFGRLLPGQISVISLRCDGDSNAQIVESMNELGAMPDVGCVRVFYDHRYLMKTAEHNDIYTHVQYIVSYAQRLSLPVIKFVAFDAHWFGS